MSRPELRARDCLARYFPRLVHNTYLPGTRFRPDFVITHGTTKLVIEVDEYAHVTYDQEKERRRERVITDSLTSSGYDVVILRFDPHKARFAKLMVDIVDLAIRIVTNQSVTHILERLDATVDDHVIRVY